MMSWLHCTDNLGIPCSYLDHFYGYLDSKIKQTKKPLQKFSSDYKAETEYEGRLKVVLLLQVRIHDFVPTFIILVLIGKILSDQLK